MDESLVFKIIVLGQQAVGKSSMLIKYIKGQFTEQYHVTVGVEFASKTVRIDQKTAIKIQVWDTAGQQAFRAIMRSFYKGIAGIFLVFGIDSSESFSALDEWYKEAKDNAHQEAVLFLVGTKADLEFQRKVTIERANQYLKKIEAVFYIETSAKTGINIETLFEKAAKIMHKKYMTNSAFKHLVRPALTSGIQNYRSDSVRLTNKEQIKKKGCC